MSNERVARSVALEQAYVHDVYEQFCDNPRSRPWPRIQEFIENLEPGSIVCDVGCGNGKYLNVSASVFNMGGEKCKRLSELAREKDSEVLVLDNMALPIRDESMDAVLSIAVVHHFATTERRVCALRELARVLRIGGRLIISVWAMEQAHRKFESQDVLVPWHRPRQLGTPSLELTSTSNTSEDDCHLPYHDCNHVSDSDSTKLRSKKRGKTKHRDRKVTSSPSGSSLSSPNETCYSFVRRAIQKLAGGRRTGAHRPWFLDTWTNCAKDHPPLKRFDPDGCECCDCENAQDLPIELRRVDDEEAPRSRRQTFPTINDISNLKSKSMNNVTVVENNNIVRSNSSIPNVDTEASQTNRPRKPKLVKQKKSICEEDAEEALDKPTEIETVVPDVRVETGRYTRGSVQKQRSLNEELMSADRLREKEKLRRHIHKQASLNEDLIYHRQYSFENIRDSLFSTSTAKRLQLIKTGFTNKIKGTNIERVTGASLKNGFVRMFQNWKSSEMIPEDESVATPKRPTVEVGERRQSKEDGSDSSKDSSLQSDTSVDSEDSFASVIFVPKSNPMSPTLSPGPNASVPNSPRIKQSSCPTSPRVKQMPLSVYPLTKQLSSPKPSSVSTMSPVEPKNPLVQKPQKSLAQKYAVAPIPKFKKTADNVTKPDKGDEDKLKKIKDLLSSKPGFGMRLSRHHFPIVRHSSINNGKLESVAKPLPKLLSLELFNPETDDKDSDSSAVSSPDSVDSVVSLDSRRGKFTFPEKSMTLLQAVADVASSLDNAVEKAIGSSPRVKRRDVRSVEVRSVLERRYSTDTEDCHRHLTDFADELSEKLLREIDQYQEKIRKSSASLEQIDDPYIHRLSEELQDLSKLSAEIQKQNEYLAKLSASDKQYGCCAKCRPANCSCPRKPRLKVSDPDEPPKLRNCASIDSCDSEKGGGSPSSASLHFGHSVESDRDTNSVSRYSDGGSTASLASCPEWKTVRGRIGAEKQRSSFDEKTEPFADGSKDKSNLLSDTSQESLPSDNVGGEITYHRYYHVFREGELDQLIEKYVENLHIISSYYDHASWCVVAEKVQVWTI